MRSILVPTDVSETASSALHLAMRIARQHGSKLTILHVSSDGDDLEAMAALRKQVESDLPSSLVLARGEPAPAILDAATEARADLIVMGSHGRGASRLVVGSVAKRVARAATCPVLVVRAGSMQSAVGAFDRVLVAVDYSPLSRFAAKIAAELLSRRGRLSLLHVGKEVQPLASDGLFINASWPLAANQEQRAEDAAALQKFASELGVDAPVRCEVTTGPVPRAIFDRAMVSGADLIVVGSRAHGGITEKILGSTAEHVLRHADRPVLIVPEPPVGQNLRRSGGDARRAV